MTMISVAEAEKIVLQNVFRMPAVLCPAADAVGLVLREDVRADRDLPPFDRVTMDGIALALAACQAGRGRFRVEATAHAGDSGDALKDPENGCIQVMTGAALPGGCDVVIPIENVKIEGSHATLSGSVVLDRMQYVHRKASDRWRGELLLRLGTVLQSPQVAILASVGKAKVRVSSRPAVAIVSTGDELVDIEDEPGPHQMRRSNDEAMLAALRRLHCTNVTCSHAPDDQEQLEEHLRSGLDRHQVLIVSGGVSMGKRDFVPGALRALGVELLFHTVSQRPGKPMAFGRTADGKVVFAVPGNPVSSLVCFHRYVLPFLLRSMNALPVPPESVVLGESVTVDEPRTRFLAVSEDRTVEGLPLAMPVKQSGSGDFASLADTSGFIELAPRAEPYVAGGFVRYHRWMC